VTLLTNSVEGVTPSGTTLTQGAGGNTGGTSGSFFDTITTGTGVTLASDSTQAAHGSLSAKFATGGTSASAWVQWDTSMGTQTTVWFRLYLYFTANPAANIKLFQALNVSTQAGDFQINTSGKIDHVAGTGSTPTNTGSVAIALNQWVRLEGFITTSATVGQLEHKLFNTMDSTSPDETLTDAASGNTNTAVTKSRIGIPVAASSVGPFWLDDFGLSSTGYIGPAVTAVTATAEAAAVAAAAPPAVPAVTAAAGVAAVAAVAPAATVAPTASAGVAVSQATAPGPSAAATANVPAATVLAVARPPSTAATATAAPAAVLAVAPAPHPAITATAGVAIVGATAPGATVNTSGSTNAPAAVAASTVAAPAPLAAVQAMAGAAAVTAAAPAVTLALTAQAQAAAALARALAPAVTLGGAVTKATSTATVTAQDTSLATVTDPRDGTATVTAATASSPSVS
jgi:hypothetical protein